MGRKSVKKNEAGIELTTDINENSDVAEKNSGEDKKAEEGNENKTGKLKTFFNEIRGEYRKIVWPTRPVLIKETFTVIVTCLMIGAIIAGLDFLLSEGYIGLVNLVVGS